MQMNTPSKQAVKTPNKPVDIFQRDQEAKAEKVQRSIEIYGNKTKQDKGEIISQDLNIIINFLSKHRLIHYEFDKLLVHALGDEIAKKLLDSELNNLRNSLEKNPKVQYNPLAASSKGTFTYKVQVKNIKEIIDFIKNSKSGARKAEIEAEYEDAAKHLGILINNHTYRKFKTIFVDLVKEQLRREKVQNGEVSEQESHTITIILPEFNTEFFQALDLGSFFDSIDKYRTPKLDSTTKEGIKNAIVAAKALPGGWNEVGTKLLNVYEESKKNTIVFWNKFDFSPEINPEFKKIFDAVVLHLAENDNPLKLAGKDQTNPKIVSIKAFESKAELNQRQTILALRQPEKKERKKRKRTKTTNAHLDLPQATENPVGGK